MESWVQSWRPRTVPMSFAICSFHLSKVLRRPRESEARSYGVLHLSRKIILPNLKIWCSNMQPLWGNQHPELLTCLTHVSLLLRLPREIHLCRSSSNVPRLPTLLQLLRNYHVLLALARYRTPYRIPCACHTKRCFSVQKWHEHVAFLAFSLRNLRGGATTACTFSLKFQTCSEHGVFDFQICFAPQRHALFRHVNVQKCSEHGAFCTFWLGNVLRATAACIFSSLIWPDGSAPAALASLLLDPPCLFSDSSHLCFSICRKFDF